MTDIFSIPVDELYAFFGKDAVYTPTTGPTQNIKALVKNPGDILGVEGSAIQTETSIFRVRQSEVITPKKGETLTISGVVYVIQGEPIKDPHGYHFVLDTYPQ